MTLTVHHLHVSQSERVVWLCEELAIPYSLQTYDRAPFYAPEDLKALHPAQTAPVIQDSARNVTLAESGACMEYIARVHGASRLFLPPDHPSYAAFLYWWHWGNGTLMPAVGRAGTGVADDMRGWAEGRRARALDAMERWLAQGKGGWLAGGEFTAADVMAVFSLTTMRYFAPFGLEGYPRILEYLQRVGNREAYQRAMRKGDPDMVLLLGKDGPEKTFKEMQQEKGLM